MYYSSFNNSLLSRFFVPLLPKPLDKQTESVVINMADTSVTVEAVKQQFKDWPMPGLKKVIVIDQFGKITRIQ